MFTPQGFTRYRNRFAWTLLALCALWLTPAARAQWTELPRTGSLPSTVPDRTVLAGQSGLAPLLTAKLVHPKANAKNHAAAIAVKTEGVHLTAPAASSGVPWLDEAHLCFQLDGGEPVYTTNLVTEFHNLASGEHQILVALVGNDNRLIGESKALKVHVP